MDEPRADKAAVVAEVAERLDAAEAVVLTDYRGLDVAAMAELRSALRQVGGTYKIYKNTLVRLATRERGLELDDLLVGPTALAFVDGDVAGVAKALRDYGRTNPSLVVKGGLLGGSLLGADDVRALADLPNRDQLLAEIAGLFAAPLQQMASLLDAVPRTFSYALGALIEAGGAPGAPTDDGDSPAAPEPTDDAEGSESPVAAVDDAPVTTSEDVPPAPDEDAPADDSPVATLEDVPPAAAEDAPAVTADENPAATAGENPAATAGETPAATADETPAATADDTTPPADGGPETPAEPADTQES